MYPVLVVLCIVRVGLPLTTKSPLFAAVPLSTVMYTYASSVSKQEREKEEERKTKRDKIGQNV
jgi:hypothetical protein